MMELTRALEVVSLVKGLVKWCQFKRKSTEGGWHCITDCRQVMTMLQSFVITGNRFDICRHVLFHCWPLHQRRTRMHTIVSVSLQREGWPVVKYDTNWTSDDFAAYFSDGHIIYTQAQEPQPLLLPSLSSPILLTWTPSPFLCLLLFSLPPSISLLGIHEFTF